MLELMLFLFLFLMLVVGFQLFLSRLVEPHNEHFPPPQAPPDTKRAAFLLHVTRWTDSIPSLPQHPWGWSSRLDKKGIPVASPFDGSIQHRYCSRLKGWLTEV
jgi:hypothetical protein